MTDLSSAAQNDDRMYQTCKKCGKGTYQETSIHDDWDGVLHCTNKKCNHEVKRYKSEDNPPPKPEKVKLSPVAQAVLDAAINVAKSLDAEAIAFAIRAAADQLINVKWSVEMWELHQEFYIIATELESSE